MRIEYYGETMSYRAAIVGTCVDDIAARWLGDQGIEYRYIDGIVYFRRVVDATAYMLRFS